MNDIITRLRAKKGDEGFTLIELLVVVVIIGVLVAIAVPVYLNYRQGAADKSAQSDARGAISTIEQYSSDNSTYPLGPTPAIQTVSFYLSATSAAMVGTGGNGLINLSEKTSMTYLPTLGVPTTTATAYLLCAKNSGGTGKVFVYDSTLGGSVKAATGTINMATCKV